VHPDLARSLVDEHRGRIAAQADRRRLVLEARHAHALAERSDDRDTRDLIWVGAESLRVRPIAMNDAEALVRLFHRLSPRSILQRFLAPLHRLPEPVLTRLVDVDHHCREALVAVRDEEIVAVARYDGRCAWHEAEIALTVDDAWQRRGLASRLGPRLAQLAVERRIDTFTATIGGENRAALRLVRQMAPRASIRFADGEYAVSIPLVRASGNAA
jgi:GNAT superfamily N-acetyltransferase